MTITELITVYWDGDRTALPSIPQNEQCEDIISSFMQEMDDFIHSWNPLPPLGEGWTLIEKDWFCVDLCDGCGIKAYSASGCPHQGVSPHSIWERQKPTDK